jgi:teichuronic acid biosynthesis glycosyltransferase TuaG
MVERPMVSVLMAAFNAAEFIGPAIESFLDQTYRASELLVVDDASTDGTASIVERYAEKEPSRVRLIRLGTNGGPCRARNVALDHARGEFIAWLDDDDLWLPSKLEEQIRVLLERPEVGLVYSYFDTFDSESEATIDWPDGRRDIEGDILADLFFVGCFIGSVTTLWRRSALETRQRRLRDRDFSFGDDYWLWLTIALDWQVARIPRVLARYRRHAGNFSARTAAGAGHLLQVTLLEEFLAQFPDASPRLGSKRGKGMARHLLLAAGVEAARGHRLAAARLRMRAVLWDPACLRRGERRTLLAG